MLEYHGVCFSRVLWSKNKVSRPLQVPIVRLPKCRKTADFRKKTGVRSARSNHDTVFD
jgi:hypothetical protein